MMIASSACHAAFLLIADFGTSQFPAESAPWGYALVAATLITPKLIKAYLRAADHK